MEPNNNLANENQPNQFNSSYNIALLIRHKYFILIISALFAIGAIILVLLMPNWYKATTNVVQPKVSGSMFEGASGISSALKEFGMTKLKGDADSYSFNVIMDSYSIRDTLINRFNLAKDYDIPDTARIQLHNALDDNLDIVFNKEGNFLISISSKDPKKAAIMTNEFVDIVNIFARSIYQKESVLNRQYLENRLNATDSILKLISDSLEIFSKSKSIFSPVDQAKAIATAYSDIKSELMKQEILLSTIENRFGANDPMTLNQRKLIEELKLKVDDIENKPGFGGNFTLKNASSVGIRYIKLYAEFEAFTKVKSFLLPSLEDAKLNERKNSIALIAIDKAFPPNKKSRPMRTVIVAGSAVGGFIISLLFILIVDSYKRIKKEYLN